MMKMRKSRMRINPGTSLRESIIILFSLMNHESSSVFLSFSIARILIFAILFYERKTIRKNDNSISLLCFFSFFLPQVLLIQLVPYSGLSQAVGSILSRLLYQTSLLVSHYNNSLLQWWYSSKLVSGRKKKVIVSELRWVKMHKIFFSK